MDSNSIQEHQRCNVAEPSHVRKCHVRVGSLQFFISPVADERRQTELQPDNEERVDEDILELMAVINQVLILINPYSNSDKSE